VHRFVLAFLATSFAILQSASEVLPSVTLNIQAEEYAIYSSILDTLDAHGQGDRLFIINQTSESYDLDYLLEAYQRQEKPYLLPSTLLDFRRRQVHRYHLTSEFETRHIYQLFNKEEYDEAFKDGCLSWCDFYKKYENSSGIVRFSRVGFSRDGSQALVYVSYGCGGLCGWGGYRVLRKQDGVWKLEKGMVSWVS
jgi:hypothetical protein